MAYIGNQPALQYITFAKQTFTANGSTVAFTLDNSVANENELEVFVNNVRQEPGSGKAYTASGTTLTMSEAPNTGDDFYCIYQGRATQTVTPGNGTVHNDHLSGNIANSKLANSSITLNGSAVSLGGSADIIEPDNWQYFSLASNTSQLSSATSSVITGWGTPSLNADLLFNFGTQYVTQSSGIFSFSTEGYYKVLFRASGSTHGATEYNSYIDRTTDNSSYNDAIDVNDYVSAGGGFNFTLEGIFKITDTTNHKLRFSVYPHSANMTFAGNGSRLRTYCRFTRIGTAT